MSEVEQPEVPAYLVALQKSSLLLPSTMVAEIIPYEPLQRVEDSPDYLLGLLSWRGEQVPVVSFEMLTVERGSFSLVSVASASLIVVKTVSGGALPFYALVAQALPRLVRVSEDELFDTGEATEPTEVVRAGYTDQLVSIPDIDYIEATLQPISGLLKD